MKSNPGPDPLQAVRIILLIRHGENDVMKTHLAGRLPGVHLNATGQNQARKLAKSLSAQPIRRIFSSPLERALETAAPLAGALGLPVLALDGLNEVDYGHWQGRSYKQLARSKLWTLVQNQPGQVRFPGGEMLTETQERVLAALNAMGAELQAGDALACFTHGDVVRLAAAACLKMDLNEFQRLQVDPGSVTAMEWKDGSLRRVLYLNRV